MRLFFEHAVPMLFDKECRYPPIPNAYLEALAGWKRPRTVRKYAGQLLGFLQWCEDQGVDWERIDKPRIWEFARAVKGGNNTFNGVMFRLRDLYRFASLHHDTPNPMEFFGGKADRLKKRKDKPASISIVSDADAKRFIKGFLDPQHRLMATVFHLTGLRLSEVLSLPRTFLDLTPLAGKVKYTVEGKGGVIRHLIMSWELRERIAGHAKGTAGPFIFTADGVRSLHRDTVEKAFQRNTRRTGVRITPHMFRHMYATRRLAELEQSHKSSDGLNSPLKALQMELGHARITTTSIYLHVASMEEASDTLAAYHRKELKDL